MRARNVGLLLGGGLVLGIFLALLRGEPRWNSDQGLFLTIAARMLDGDRLYADVIENKEPLFLYANVPALWIGGWKGPAALDALWFALAAVSFALLLRELRAPTAAVVAGFFLYPLALTASWYEPGLSMLGGLAVAPFVGWLWLRGNFVASGAALSVVMLLKITAAPLAAAPLCAFLIYGAPAGSRLRQAGLAAAGFVGATAAIAAFMAVRGELGGFLDVLAFNREYPDAARRLQGGSGSIASHLSVVREFFLQSGAWQWSAALLSLVVLAGAAVVGARKGGRAFRLLAAAAIGTTLAAILTLGLTAIWFAHLQMLALPVAFIGVVVIAATTTSLTPRVGAGLAAGIVALAFWASAKQEVHAGTFGEAWRSGKSSVGADLLEQARLRYHANDERVTYMVFGSNSENAHGVFIDDAFDLECRWFHLYPHNLPEHFTETLDCGAEKSPELVLVTVGFYESRGFAPVWDAFVDDASTFLETRYVKVADQDMFQVWKRKEGSD